MGLEDYLAIGIDVLDERPSPADHAVPEIERAIIIPAKPTAGTHHVPGTMRECLAGDAVIVRFQDLGSVSMRFVRDPHRRTREM